MKLRNITALRIATLLASTAAATAGTWDLTSLIAAEWAPTRVDPVLELLGAVVAVFGLSGVVLAVRAREAALVTASAALLLDGLVASRFAFVQPWSTLVFIAAQGCFIVFAALVLRAPARRWMHVLGLICMACVALWIAFTNVGGAAFAVGWIGAACSRTGCLLVVTAILARPVMVKFRHGLRFLWQTADVR
jgi:hypothetical protein